MVLQLLYRQIIIVGLVDIAWSNPVRWRITPTGYALIDSDSPDSNTTGVLAHDDSITNEECMDYCLLSIAAEMKTTPELVSQILYPFALSTLEDPQFTDTCIDYQVSRHCVNDCDASDAKTITQTIFNTLQFLCIDKIIEIRPLLPCILRTSLEMSDQCSDCGVPMAAQQLTVDINSAADAKDRRALRHHLSSLCQYKVCMIQCELPERERLCQGDTGVSRQFSTILFDAARKYLQLIGLDGNFPKQCEWLANGDFDSIFGWVTPGPRPIIRPVGLLNNDNELPAEIESKTDPPITFNVLQGERQIKDIDSEVVTTITTPVVASTVQLLTSSTAGMQLTKTNSRNRSTNFEDNNTQLQTTTVTDYYGNRFVEEERSNACRLSFNFFITIFCVSLLKISHQTVFSCVHC